eukprot:10562498-Karenia_brevis.AAC.1
MAKAKAMTRKRDLQTGSQSRTLREASLVAYATGEIDKLQLKDDHLLHKHRNTACHTYSCDQPPAKWADA